MANNGVVLFLFVLLAVGTLFCGQARAEQPVVVGESDGSASNSTTILLATNSTSVTIKASEEEWKSTMTNILREYYEYNQCNIIIYKLRDLNYDRREYSLTDKSIMPKSSSVRVDKVVTLHSLNKGYLFFSDFRLLVFTSPAYFETTGWSGWSNWAFAGKFKHDMNTSKVWFL